MTERTREFNFKVVVLGDWGVGKTSLIRRHAKGRFQFDTKPTIGVEVTTKDYRLQGGLLISLSIWDVAGQEFFSAVRRQYYTGASSAILVFDVTRPESFWHVKTWYVDLRDNLQQKIPVVLLANKKDLVDQRAIPDYEIRELADGYGFKYYETSASTGENVDLAFYHLVARTVVARKLSQDVIGIKEE